MKGKHPPIPRRFLRNRKNSAHFLLTPPAGPLPYVVSKATGGRVWPPMLCHDQPEAARARKAVEGSEGGARCRERGAAARGEGRGEDAGRGGRGGAAAGRAARGRGRGARPAAARRAAAGMARGGRHGGRQQGRGHSGPPARRAARAGRAARARWRCAGGGGPSVSFRPFRRFGFRGGQGAQDRRKPQPRETPHPPIVPPPPCAWAAKRAATRRPRPRHGGR